MRDSDVPKLDHKLSAQHYMRRTTATEFQMVHAFNNSTAPTSTAQCSEYS